MSKSNKRVRDTVNITVSTPVKPFFPKKRRYTKPVEAARVVPDPRVWATALELSDGDVHRLRVNSDGSVTVLNRSRFTR